MKALSSKSRFIVKRYGNLYSKIISLDNLYLADKKARKGKKNSYGIKLHDKNREQNLLDLHNKLLTKTYKTSEYDMFTIHEPKERLIYRLPYYPDRIVHHAIMNILEPIWVKTFTYNTYSCIKKRGIEGCAKRVEEIIKSFEDSKKVYCLKIDIRKFYPSIKHHVLKRLVRRKIKDKDLLYLIDEIIDSTDGLPIGNYLSQYLANICLCYFMHWVNERLPELIKEELSLKEKPVIKSAEYADDIVFITDNKDILHSAFIYIKQYIETELELEVKSNYQIFPIGINRYDKYARALDYVGYKFFRKQKLIRKFIKQNFCRAVVRLNKRKNITLEQYKQNIASWLGWAQHSNSKHLLKTIIKPEYYESII